MISAKTLLVVGAGASKEVGLPVGSELASSIAALLTFRFDFGSLAQGDATFFQTLRRHFTDTNVLNSHLSAAAQIREGVTLVNSIDNYIDTHRNDPRIALCGKAAIVYSILQAERKSLLREREIADGSQGISLSDLNKTWFMAFGRILVDQISTADLDRIFF